MSRLSISSIVVLAVGALAAVAWMRGSADHERALSGGSACRAPRVASLQDVQVVQHDREVVATPDELDPDS
jgi:hypothetical protein